MKVQRLIRRRRCWRSSYQGLAPPIRWAKHHGRSVIRNSWRCSMSRRVEGTTSRPASNGRQPIASMVVPSMPSHWIRLWLPVGSDAVVERAMQRGGEARRSRSCGSAGVSRDRRRPRPWAAAQMSFVSGDPRQGVPRWPRGQQRQRNLQHAPRRSTPPCFQPAIVSAPSNVAGSRWAISSTTTSPETKRFRGSSSANSGSRTAAPRAWPDPEPTGGS